MKDFAAAPGRAALLGVGLISCMFLFTLIHFVLVKKKKKKLEHPRVRSSRDLTFCPTQHKYQTAPELLSRCFGKGEEG